MPGKPSAVFLPCVDYKISPRLDDQPDLLGAAPASDIASEANEVCTDLDCRPEREAVIHGAVSAGKALHHPDARRDILEKRQLVHLGYHLAEIERGNS